MLRTRLLKICLVKSRHELTLELLFADINGWAARTRTWECGDQNPVPYQLGDGPIRIIL